MTSPSTSTSRRSPALRPSFRRASLGTAIWCLVLILTLSMREMLCGLPPRSTPCRAAETGRRGPACLLDHERLRCGRARAAARTAHGHRPAARRGPGTHCPTPGDGAARARVLRAEAGRARGPRLVEHDDRAGGAGRGPRSHRGGRPSLDRRGAVSYTHLRAHETVLDLV